MDSNPITVAPPAEPEVSGYKPQELEVYVYSKKLQNYKSEQLTTVGENVWAKELSEDLIHTTKCHRAIGVAAAQCGIFTRMCVIMHDGYQAVMVNPVILETKGQQQASEGCLSLPGVIAKTTRAAEIMVRTRLLEGGIIGGEQTLHFEGFRAVVVQHEIDHLDGKFFIDHMSLLKRNIIEKRFLQNVDEQKKLGEMKRRGIPLTRDNLKKFGKAIKRART